MINNLETLRKITHCGHSGSRTPNPARKSITTQQGIVMAYKCGNPMPRAQKSTVHFTLHGRFCRNFRTLQVCHIAGYPSEHNYGISVFAHFLLCVSSHCVCVLQFRQSVSLAHPEPFSVRQHTCERLRLVIMCITLAYTFLKFPCGQFLPHCDFYLRAHWAQLWHYLYRYSFLHGSRTPKFSCFACTDKITQF